MQLFHFSDKGDIEVFEPRPVEIPSQRSPGMDWLNGPLVWAIDGWHQPMYLFPRNCPRILVWPVATTTAQDRRNYWTKSACRMIAFIEWDWLDRLTHAVVYRYALSGEHFESLHDAGMWVSRSAAVPIEVSKLDNIPDRLNEAGVELRVLPSLQPLKQLGATSLHVSGIRLRNLHDGAMEIPSY